MSSRLISLLVCVVLSLLTSSASAYSGNISGHLGFYNQNGNYCPTSRDCTGAVYLQSQFNTYQGVKEVKVYVADSSTFAVLGQGVSDLSGNYNVFWSDTVMPAHVYVFWRMEQKDGRFTVHDINGNFYNFYTPNYVPVNGSNVNAGSWNWSGPYANVYDGADLMWRESLNYVGLMQTYFNNIDIRGFESTTNPPCPTSCAAGTTITLDAGAGYEPQGRVMHEMGHIASGLAKAWTSGSANGSYCYPATSGMNCGWSLTSPQWELAGFEEGLATFLGDAALYYPNATQPHTCLSNSFCSTGSFNEETSTGQTNCGATEGREPISAVRYLWDIYDSVNDNESDNIPFWQILANMSNYPSGTSLYAIDEAWKSDYSAIKNYDGRGNYTYYYHQNGSYNHLTYSSYVNNCHN